MGLILGLHTITRRQNKRQLRLFSVLGTVMLGFVVVMLIAAFRRLQLYEIAFGFTFLRLYSQVFMVWLGFNLLWSAVVLWAQPERMGIGLLVTTCGFLVSLNVLNVDATIVRLNVAHQQPLMAESRAPDGDGLGNDRMRRRGGDIDARYLIGLSDDAVPALVAALPELPREAQQIVGEELSRRLERYQDKQPWISFHLGRSRARQAVTAWRETQ